MNKCVFTIHFGGYDAPHEPFKSEGWDYILFTNRDDIESDVWDVCKMVSPLPNHLAARYVYINSHRFIPSEYEYSLMVGGQVHILGDLNNLDIDYDKDFNMMKHPCRTCIYKEAELILREGIDKSGNVEPTMERYRAVGFPEDFGLNACGIIGRHNNGFTECFEQEWWHQVMIGSYRDQLSFDYVRHMLGGEVHNFKDGYWDLLRGDIFSIHQHGTGKKL